MNPNPPNSGHRNAYKSDGTLITQDATGMLTLPAGTYYVEVGSSSAPLPSRAALVAAHCAWNAALAATITYETSNMPAQMVPGMGPVVLTSWEAVTVGGNWIPENPSTAIVAVVGASNSSTAATVTAGGAAIGGCMFHLGNMGARRIRLKIVVTVAGTMMVNVHGKVAG